MFVACGGGSSDSKDGDSAEKKDGEDKGDAKGGDGDGGAAKPEVKKKEFKKFGDGEAPIEMSEWAFKAEKNFLGPEGSKNLKGTFKVKSVKKVEQGMMMTIKSTCKLGDEYLADSSSPLIQLEKLEPGETKEADTILYGLSGFEGDPEVCEVSVYFSKMISSDPPYHMADYCFKGDAVTDGKCDGFTRPAGDGTPLKITKASAKLEEIKFGDNKGRKDLRHEYTVLVGNTIDDGKSIFVKTACQVGDEKIVDESPVMALFTYVEPGESMRVSGSSYPMKGVASDPSQCDLTFMLKGLFDDGGDSFGDYCFKDGALNEGKCG